MFDFEGQLCPEEHQFAFGNGDFCCTSQEDENGELITDKSTSCNGKSISCPMTPCVDNYGNVLLVFQNMNLIICKKLLIKEDVCYFTIIVKYYDR